METQTTIARLISLLTSSDLVQAPSENWLDRQSGLLRVRATFTNGQSMSVDLTGKKDIADIQDLFQENLKKVFTRTSDFRDLLTLEIGKRYTLIVESEMGFGVGAIHFTLQSVRVGRFAQYDNCIELVFTPKKKRNLHSTKFYGKKDFALFDGWVDVDTNPFGPAEDQGIMTVRKMKYSSCDERFMSDAIASVKVAPLFMKRFARGGAK